MSDTRFMIQEIDLRSPFSYPVTLYHQGMNLWRVLRLHGRSVTKEELSEILKIPEYKAYVQMLMKNPNADQATCVHWIISQASGPRADQMKDIYFQGATAEEVLRNLVYRRPVVEMVLPLNESDPIFPGAKENVIAWIERIHRLPGISDSGSGLGRDVLEGVFSPSFQNGLPREILLRRFGPREDATSLSWILYLPVLETELSRARPRLGDFTFCRLADLAFLAARAEQDSPHPANFLHEQNVAASLFRSTLLTALAFILGSPSTFGSNAVLPRPCEFEPAIIDSVATWRTFAQRYVGTLTETFTCAPSLETQKPAAVVAFRATMREFCSGLEAALDVGNWATANLTVNGKLLEAHAPLGHNDISLSEATDQFTFLWQKESAGSSIRTSVQLTRRNVDAQGVVWFDGVDIISSRKTSDGWIETQHFKKTDAGPVTILTFENEQGVKK